MDPQGKSKRKYNSTRRQEQARETRRQIIAAAGRLFPEYGYTGTTIEAIAREAGVAQETVFAIFGSKRAILAALIEIRVGGDDRPIPLLQREEQQKVLHETDPVRQIQEFARGIASILARMAPIFEIVRMAAKTEPETAELLKNMLNQRLRNLSVFVHHLAANRPLRDGLDEGQATETVWAITSPEIYQLLTVDRGWSHERYVQWLGDSLLRLLLS